LRYCQKKPAFDGKPPFILLFLDEKSQSISLFQDVSQNHSPGRHDVRKEDINMNRLASVLDLAYNCDVENFEELLNLHGIGPRTLKTLAIASAVIYDDATRFDDPARFSFAVGEKDGRPHPIDTKAFDETVEMLQNSIDKSKLGDKDKFGTLKRLHDISVDGETKGVPIEFLQDFIDHEWNHAENSGGETSMGSLIKGVCCWSEPLPAERSV
jgi:uncharacterized protein